jgi:hypothetical protein
MGIEETLRRESKRCDHWKGRGATLGRVEVRPLEGSRYDHWKGRGATVRRVGVRSWESKRRFGEDAGTRGFRDMKLFLKSLVS